MAPPAIIIAAAGHPTTVEAGVVITHSHISTVDQVTIHVPTEQVFKDGLQAEAQTTTPAPPMLHVQPPLLWG